jgi:hypothetical protein
VQVRGTIHFVELPPATSGPEWERVLASAEPAMLASRRLALENWDPVTGSLTLLFGDVEDQMAFERSSLATNQGMLLKSPDGGVWNIVVVRRTSTALTRKDNPYTIVVRYEVKIVEAINTPPDSARNGI